MRALLIPVICPVVCCPPGGVAWAIFGRDEQESPSAWNGLFEGLMQFGQGCSNLTNMKGIGT
jgi:hypothetical protein